MQALAERLALFTEGRTLEKVDLLGFSSLKTFAPPVEELYGQEVRSITRRAKYLVWTFSEGPRIVMHLSQAGRVDAELPVKKTRPRGSVARFVLSGSRVPTIPDAGGPGPRARDAAQGVMVDFGAGRRRAVGGLGARAGLRGLRRAGPHEYELPASPHGPA